jgi:hypothetical protein
LIPASSLDGYASNLNSVDTPDDQRGRS